jgi:hypothetical protein
MSQVRARKEASKRLSLAIQSRYRILIEASGENELVIATTDLATILYENVEHIINVLREHGGLEAKFEPMTKPGLPTPANDLPEMPSIFAAGRDVIKPH